MKMGGAQDSDAALIAARAVKALLGRDATEITAIRAGLSNQVFRVQAGSDRVIVRAGPEEQKLPLFEREQRVIVRVRANGVPAPEVLGVGSENGTAWMIERELPGTIAKDHPGRLRTLKELGALAARSIHAIQTIGHGDSDSFGTRPAATWQQWLKEDLKAEARIAVLKDNDLISDKQEAEARQCLKAIAEWTAQPVLNHGDLRLKNVLVDDSGTITGLVDWEDSISAPGPHWDLSIAFHDLWVDQIQAFLDGYGMDSETIHASSPAWKLFNTLNYAPVVQQALAVKDEETIERIRTRFSGALDVFLTPEKH